MNISFRKIRNCSIRVHIEEINGNLALKSFIIKCETQLFEKMTYSWYIGLDYFLHMQQRQGDTLVNKF